MKDTGYKIMKRLLFDTFPMHYIQYQMKTDNGRKARALKAHFRLLI